MSLEVFIIIKPNEIRIIASSGKISDELDWKVSQFLLKERGPGYTSCQPSLVEIEGDMGPKETIKLLIDLTTVMEDGVYGYGIIGEILVDFESEEIIYCTPKEVLEERANKVIQSAQPQKRPLNY